MATTTTERDAEELAALTWSTTSGVPYFDSRSLETPPQLGSLMSLRDLWDYGVAPIRLADPHSLELGLTDKTNRQRLPELQQKLPDVQISFKTISGSGYNTILNRLYVATFAPEQGGDFAAFTDKLTGMSPKTTFPLIAQLAYLLGASDIHIEPAESEARIRLRIDGTLHHITGIETERYKIVLADLQTRAGIKWGSDIPQSGRISFDLVDATGKSRSVDMRLETIPAFHGEEIVARLFNTEPRALELPNMGFSDKQIELITITASRSSGMVLTVGPTGSGKTSTLYAIINRLNNPQIKIVTLEDPVEYDLPGISQIPVASEDKELFAEKLRAVLREDPNIIMIGEIRDADTARTALQASLTGHLVLSTFHAASAAAAISRLLDMMDGNPLLASAIRLIIAQRLVRRVCPACNESYTPAADTAAMVTQALQTLPDSLRPDLANISLRRSRGCAVCHNIGYQGRIGIIEQLPITPEMEQLMTGGKTTAQAIETQALAEGMVTLLQDGLLKALAGLTTLEEIQRVADL
ncbi:MAG TPA: GspE/PulE family protein [Candidatus Saccharimonadales bacterium]|nr:GspE/PulE family protein [Candidatus Saccharimonadales bacterium]